MSISLNMIEVNGLVKRHESTEILKGLSLSIGRGEVATLIGPSGCGKSTLLRCLNGLETFQEGSIVVDGVRLEPGDAGERLRTVRQLCLRLGMVFQDFNLFPQRTVLENVIEGPVWVLGLSREQAEDRAFKLLDRVGMSQRLRALPRELSGGQKQRVAIARALAMEPQAILFDEPTSALDPWMSREVQAVMSDLAGEGRTMVVVTHDMSFARRVSQVVHVFGEGRIIESGPPAQIFEDPRHEATRTLLAGVLAA